MRVNVGCGASPTAGWENLDNSLSVRLAWVPVIGRRLPSYLPQIARENNIRYGKCDRLPWETGSVEVLYSSHMVEHLEKAEARVFLSEARRVLQPGGYLRLAVPDLNQYAKDYLASGDADEFVERTLLTRDRVRGVKGWVRFAIVGERGHLWMYDGPSLASMVKEAGFVDPVVLKPGETTIPEPGSLNLFERGDDSIYVEARQPETP